MEQLQVVEINLVISLEQLVLDRVKEVLVHCMYIQKIVVGSTYEVIVQ